MEFNIKVKNSDNIILDGIYTKANKNKCVIFLHGFAGCYDSMAKSIAASCIQNNFSFLFCKTQGYGIISEMKKQEKEIITITRGACYENLKDYEKDYLAWFDFIEKENFEEIYLICYSLACNKIIDFLNKYSFKNIKKIIFIAPQDLTRKISEDKINYERAKTLYSKQPNSILPNKFLGFCDISANTYLQFKNNSFIHNFKYKNSKDDFKLLNNIKLPKLIIIGNQDEGLKNFNANLIFTNVKQKVENLNFYIINDCKHTFKNKLEDLNQKIISFLTGGKQWKFY